MRCVLHIIANAVMIQAVKNFKIPLSIFQLLLTLSFFCSIPLVSFADGGPSLPASFSVSHDSDFRISLNACVKTPTLKRSHLKLLFIWPPHAAHNQNQTYTLFSYSKSEPLLSCFSFCDSAARAPPIA